jgi:threonine dehydrogenase-like Zn-dependent dehydrogenase
MTRLLATEGKGAFFETHYEIDPIESDGIRVQSVMTGVCRSDIDMMKGDFGPLPLVMSGHEGLGQVIAIGPDVRDVQLGDYVATRGEPAYADMYNVRHNEYVYVPEAHPRYILEPVACGINIINQAYEQIKDRKGKLLILGSGFLAYVAYQTLKAKTVTFDIDVLGTSNQDVWGDEQRTILGDDRYDVVIDLVGRYEIGTDVLLANEALIIDGVGKAVSKEEAQEQLWKACTTVRPSPRTNGFYQCMRDAEWFISNGVLNVDSFWTKSYDRDTEWEQAFLDGANRPKGYGRGYIVW